MNTKACVVGGRRREVTGGIERSCIGLRSKVYSLRSNNEHGQDYCDDTPNYNLKKINISDEFPYSVC